MFLYHYTVCTLQVLVSLFIAVTLKGELNPENNMA